MVRALVGDSTMTSARFPPRRATRLPDVALGVGAGGALGLPGFDLGAARLATGGLAGAALRDGAAFDFGAGAFDPFAFGVGVLCGFDFFGLVLAIGPDL